MKKIWTILFTICILNALFYVKGVTQHRIDLASATADLEIIGLASVNRTGHALAVGDINGDSIDDLIIGAPGLDEESRPKEGRVYVLFGSTTLPSNLNLNTDAADLEIEGRESHTGLGAAVAAADINGDGFDDIIMAGPGLRGSPGEKVGAVFIIFGRASFPRFMSVLDVDVRISGEAALDGFGEALATGDLNNDGNPDLIVGVPLADPPNRGNGGKVFVIYGKTEWPPILDLATTPADMVVLGQATAQFLGNSVAAADLNNDGRDDLIIGDFKANATGGVDAGQTYVIFGSDILDSEIDLASDEPNVTISGEDQRDHFGIAVTTGDFDGDGLSDLIIGARRADDGDPTNVGKVYVFIGSSFWPEQIDLADDSADVTIVGDAVTSNLGFALAIGNINGDEKADLVMGASFSSPEGRSQAGESFVLLGHSLSDEKISYQSGASDVIILGAEAAHSLGNAVTVGDLNGDGLDEVIVAAEDAGSAGRVYVLLGDVLTSIDSPNVDFAVPETFQLHQNYPNPFNAGTTISLEVPANAAAFEVSVFNVRGQKVNTLFNGTAQSGLLKLNWDGSDVSGRAVGNGVYIYALKSRDSLSMQRKLVLLK